MGYNAFMIKSKRFSFPIYLKCPLCKHLVLPGHLEDRDFDIVNNFPQPQPKDLELAGAEFPYLLKTAVRSLGRGKGFLWKEIPYPKRIAVRVLMRLLLSYLNLLYYLEDKENFRLTPTAHNWELPPLVALQLLYQKDKLDVPLSELVAMAQDLFDEEVEG